MISGGSATTDDVRALLTAVRGLDEADGPADRVDRLRLLEEVKAACAAAQALEAVGLDRERRVEDAAAGLPTKRQGVGVAGEIALALRQSPARGQRFLGWAKIAATELPRTFAELRAGRTTEWRAMLVARETAVLSRDDRAAVDRDVAPELEGWGDRRVEQETRRRAQRIDPAAAAERARRAESERRVGLRPVPDAMTRLTALVPLAQGVACFAALHRAAESARAAGDPRSRGQVMADTLVERVTGQRAAAEVAVEVELVISAETLLGEGPVADEPAVVPGHGPVPAPIARELALGAGARWLRRPFRHPTTGELVDLESRRRLFTEGQRRYLRLRDGSCRTPWCDAPIRHADHVQPHAVGGATTVANGQGLSEACNHQKQAPYWTTRAGPDGSVITTTPTGHTYVGRPPRLPGLRPPPGVDVLYWNRAA